MTGRTSRLALVGALAATGGLVAGCGSSNTSSVTGHVGGSAIAQAADVSGAASGEKVAFTLDEQLGSAGTLTGVGTGAFNRSPLSGQETLHMTLPAGAAATAGKSLDLRAILKNDTMYFKYGGPIGAALAQKTGGRSWISIDYKQLGSDTGLSGLSSLFNNSASQGPSSQFQEFQAAAANGLTKVGTATVNGVATTEYSATLNLEKEAAAAPAAKRAAFQQVLTAVSKDLGSDDVPVKVWIDANHMIRRYQMTEQLLENGTRVSLDMTMNILSYGRQAMPAAPAASQTENLTSQVGKSLSANGTG